MSGTEIEDFVKRPSVLDVRMDGETTIVMVGVQEMLKNAYPDGVMNGDPGIWGVILSDTIRHIAQAHRGMLVHLSEQGSGPAPPALGACLERILSVLNEEMASGDLPEISGGFVGQKSPTN